MGIAAWPLNRLRTRLSIPLGLRHEGSTPVPSQHPSSVLQFLGLHTHKAVRLVAVEALGVYRLRQFAKFAVRVRGRCIRFLTIATCFLAAAICGSQYASGISTYMGDVLCLLWGLVWTVGIVKSKLSRLELRGGQALGALVQ